MTDQSDFLRKLFADPEEERITLPATPTPPAETAARAYARELFARSSED